MQELSAMAWEQFLAVRDEAALRAVLRQLPDGEPPGNADYPMLHRICDVILQGQAYRVSRFVDLADGRERLFIATTQFADPKQGGVPYQLQGVKLRRWICKERESSAKASVAWDKYLDD